MLNPAPSIALVAVLILVSGCSPAETRPQPETVTLPTVEPTANTDPVVDPKPALHIDIRNARMPFEGILTGGQPTVGQLEEAARLDYSTVVNLRPPGEFGEWDEAQKAAELGLHYVNIPIAGADDLTAENATLLAEIVTDPRAQPLIVHCASGNRVGALFALKAFHVDGEDTEDALQKGLDAGLTSLQATVEERMTRSR